MLFGLTPSFREWTEARAVSPVGYYSMIPTHQIQGSVFANLPVPEVQGQSGGGGVPPVLLLLLWTLGSESWKIAFGSPKCCCVMPPVPKNYVRHSWEMKKMHTAELLCFLKEGLRFERSRLTLLKQSQMDYIRWQ